MPVQKQKLTFCNGNRRYAYRVGGVTQAFVEIQNSDKIQILREQQRVKPRMQWQYILGGHLGK